MSVFSLAKNILPSIDIDIDFQFHKSKLPSTKGHDAPGDDLERGQAVIRNETCSKRRSLSGSFVQSWRARMTALVMGVVLLSAFRGICAEQPSLSSPHHLRVRAASTTATVVDADATSGTQQRHRDTAAFAGVRAHHAITVRRNDDLAAQRAEVRGLSLVRSVEHRKALHQRVSPHHIVCLVDIDQRAVVSTPACFNARRRPGVEVVLGTALSRDEAIAQRDARGLDSIHRITNESTLNALDANCAVGVSDELDLRLKPRRGRIGQWGQP